MISFNRDDLRALMETRQNPSVTIYLPGQRVGAESRQNPVRLKTLARKAEDILKKQNWRQPMIDTILKPVYELIENTLFWSYQHEGLAIFACKHAIRTQVLAIPTDEFLFVSDRFYTRPLIPLLTHDGEYFLLTLALHENKLYLGSRYALEEYPVKDMPASLEEVFSSYNDEKQLGHYSGSSAAGSGGAIFHGFDNLKDIEKARIEEYFRQVDAGLHRMVYGQSPKPLVVACVDYLFPIFRQVSKYPFLMDQHIAGSPEAMPADVLIRSAWPIVQQLFEQDKEKAWTSVYSLLGTARVSVNIHKIITAASLGRVQTLFLPAGRMIAGKNGADDLLEIAAVSTFLKSGSVYETDPGKLPPDADALALLRY